MYYHSFSVWDDIFHLKSNFNRTLETLIRNCVLLTSDLDLRCLSMTWENYTRVIEWSAMENMKFPFHGIIIIKAFM